MLWLHSLKVAQLLRSAACLHTNQSRSYLNHLVLTSLFFTDRILPTNFLPFSVPPGSHAKVGNASFPYTYFYSLFSPLHCLWCCVYTLHMTLRTSHVHVFVIIFQHFRLTTLLTTVYLNLSVPCWAGLQLTRRHVGI